MDKNFQKRQSRRASMDSIALPDSEQMKKLGHKKLRGSDVNAAADEIFDGYRTVKMGNFDTASKFHEKLDEKHDDEDREDDFIPKPDPNRKAPDAMHKGVKVGSAYVQRRRVFFWIGMAIFLLICALLFLPPIMSSMAEDTSVDYDRRVFEEKGMTGFKSYAFANYSVYNEAAFSSEKNENYRTVELSVHLQNSSPFEVTIPQYKVVSVPSKYKNNLCYVTGTNISVNPETYGTITGDTIPGFSGKDVTIEIMINVTDMTDEELDKCITGLVISTVNAKKRVASKTYLPCLPAFLFVSNNVNVSLDP